MLSRKRRLTRGVTPLPLNGARVNHDSLIAAQNDAVSRARVHRDELRFLHAQS